MRQFRIECVTLNKDSAEAAWEKIADAAQKLLKDFAPDVSIRQAPNEWSYSSDEWHHWHTVFNPDAWAEVGTLIFAALLALMLRDDPTFMDFAVMLYYRDSDSEWIECG